MHDGGDLPHDPDELLLGRMAAREFILSEEVHEAAMEARAEGRIEDLTALARTHVLLARSIRQSIALKTRLRRERGRDLRAAREEARDDARHEVGRRREQVQAAVERLVWNEHEKPDADPLLDSLDEILDHDALFDDFITDPLHVHIDRVRARLGLAPGDDLRDPPPPNPPPPGGGGGEADAEALRPPPGDPTPRRSSG